MKDDDSSFNVAFVRTVRRYPMLYDSSTLSSKEDKENAWQAIAEHFEETVSNCVERWRNIRTSMGRSLKHCYQRTGSTRSCRKPYYLAKHLDFLVPFMSHRDRRRSFPPRCGETVTAQELVVAADEDDEEDEEDESDPLYEEEAADSPPETKPLVSPTDELLLLQALNAGQATSKRRASPPASVRRDKDGNAAAVKDEEEPLPAKRSRLGDQEDDADWAFLRSLLPDLRMMAPADKLAFKISLLESINSVLYSKGT